MFAHKSHKRPISAPDNIFDGWTINLCDCFLLLDIIEDDGRRGTEDDTCSATIKDLVCLNGRLNALYHGVSEVSDFDELQTHV